MSYANYALPNPARPNSANSLSATSSCGAGMALTRRKAA